MLTNRVHGITKEDYDRQEHEVSCMSNEQLALLLECITKIRIGDYKFNGTDEDLENHLLQTAMCRAIEIIKKADSE